MGSARKFCRQGLVAISFMLIPLVAAADERINAKPGDVAVQGYDVVAYFTVGEPTRGDEQYTYRWQDVRWLFSTQGHRDAFVAEPARYAPRYGGYCAGGVVLGNRAPIDPEAFVIIDDKLYLNYDTATARKFEATSDKSIARADANWERIGFKE